MDVRPAPDGPRWKSLLGDLPRDTQMLVCDLMAKEIRTTRQDWATDVQTAGAIRDHRDATVRRLLVDRDCAVANRQFQAFRNLDHLEWRSDDGQHQALLHHLYTCPRPAVFQMVRSLALTGTLEPMGVHRIDTYRGIGNVFRHLVDLRIEHRVGREDLESLAACVCLLRLQLEEADEGCFAAPCVLPEGLTRLRVLGVPEARIGPALSVCESLLELDMPHYPAFIRGREDLVRLASLRKVALADVFLLNEEGQAEVTLPDLPTLSWTHLSLTDWQPFVPVLPLLHHLERAVMTAERLLLPYMPNEIAHFMHVFEALAGKYDTPKSLVWDEDCVVYAHTLGEDEPDVQILLSAVLSKAADRPDTLTLTNLDMDYVVDALKRHAPQLRHLTLHDCVCDPVALACEFKLETLSIKRPPEFEQAPPHHVTLILL
jgi:hypothetical protein